MVCSDLIQTLHVLSVPETIANNRKLLSSHRKLPLPMATQEVKMMLLAQDMDRAVKFHTTVFGFTEGYLSDHWSELRHGDAIIAFHSGGDGKKHPTGISIQVDDAAAVARTIEAAGGTIVTAPVQREGEPILLGTFRDPEGNEIMLTQYVG